MVKSRSCSKCTTPGIVKFGNPWADTSSFWTPSVKSQIKDWVNEDDGQFFVTPEDYLKNFGVTNWAELKKGFGTHFQDLSIKKDSEKYTVSFTVSKGNNQNVYFYIDQFDYRLLQKCSQPFSIGNIVVTGPNKDTYTGDYYNTVKIPKAADGIYTVTFDFTRTANYLKYFTISAYAAEGSVVFQENSWSSNFEGDKKTCPAGCSGKGRCNFVTGKCTCYFGVK